MNRCVCRDPGAVLWVQSVFGDCLYTTRDVVAFALGLGSIGCWLVAQLPQVVANHRNGTAEALSPWFLAEWLLGDTCNLLGCLLTGDQLPTQTFTAAYYVGMDCVMLTQFAYYAQRSARARRHEAADSECDEDAAAGDGGAVEEPALHAATTPLLPPPRRAARAGATHAPTLASLLPTLLCVALASASASPLHARGGPGGGTTLPCGATPRPLWAADLGAALGWASAACYAGARVAQLRRNAARHSAAGLSPAMFALAIAGNALYAASVALRAVAPGALRRAAPWLAGSLGVLCLDGVLVAQAARAAKVAPGADERGAAEDAGGAYEPPRQLSS